MPTILVVDDLASDRRLAGALLETNSDWDIIYASDGKEALTQLELHIPDLVVTDLMMPEMDGLELVKHVKSEYPLIPVILMTAKGSEEIAVQALNLGAASYVTKRGLAQDLHDTAERVLTVAREDRSYLRLMHRMTKHESTFVVENDLSLIFSLVGYLQQAVRCMWLGDETVRLRVGVAVEEALLNAYYHGNLEVPKDLRVEDRATYYQLAQQRCQESPYRDRRLAIDVNLSRSEAVYIIRDEGQGFDPASLPDPTDPVNLDKVTGRGLLLMRTFMDDVQFNARGNEVTLTKQRKPSEIESPSPASA